MGNSVIDLFVFPSQNEAFGLVSIEAFSHGKPVIVYSDAGGLTEIVQMISPDDVVNSENELVKRMEYYRNTADTSASERIDFARKFSKEKMEVEFFNCYKNIVQS